MATTKVEKKEDIYELMRQEGITFQSKFGYNHPKKTNGRSKNLQLGRILFNMLLPEDYPFIDEPITKKRSANLLTDIVTKYSPEVATETATKINQEAFKMGTFSPVAFTDESFTLPPHIQKKKDKILTKDLDPSEFRNITEELGNDLLEYFKSTNNPVYDIIMSGAKGSPMDYAILVIAKGSPVDIEGNALNPSTNSITEGFDLQEFYNNAAEARSGLYTRSSGAAGPGALSRDVVYANANIKLEKGDCKTKRYLDLFVTKEIFGGIPGRWYLDPKTNKLAEVTPELNLIGKTIKIRSPLHCISKKGVCNVCYGKLGETLETEHVGVMCGSVINDILLNGVAMKSRHNASNVNINKVDFNKDLVKI
jgi:DNA-directed RNA polymerase subunit beta'